MVRKIDSVTISIKHVQYFDYFFVIPKQKTFIIKKSKNYKQRNCHNYMYKLRNVLVHMYTQKKIKMKLVYYN